MQSAIEKKTFFSQLQTALCEFFVDDHIHCMNQDFYAPHFNNFLLGPHSKIK